MKNLKIIERYEPWKIEALERDGYKCTKCSRIKNIIVHHLDESRKNGYENMNNDLSNLITLCRKCHAVIHKFNKESLYINDIKRLLKTGKSYAEVGQVIGISRQRVFQLIEKYPELRNYARNAFKHLI